MFNKTINMPDLDIINTKRMKLDISKLSFGPKIYLYRAISRTLILGLGRISGYPAKLPDNRPNY